VLKVADLKDATRVGWLAAQWVAYSVVHWAVERADYSESMKVALSDGNWVE
jgi:hypothetical protein